MRRWPAWPNSAPCSGTEPAPDRLAGHRPKRRSQPPVHQALPAAWSYGAGSRVVCTSAARPAPQPNHAAPSASPPYT